MRLTDDDEPSAAAAHKHDFSIMYDQPTPAMYIEAMLALDYREPDYLTEAEADIADFVARHFHGERLTVLDLCSGYGLNAVFLRLGLSGKRLLERVAAALPVDSAVPSRWGPPLRIVGADIARNALLYAEAMRLHDSSIASNLEKTPPTAAEADELADVDLITSTGSLSYISERTIERILAAIPPYRPLLALFWPIVGRDTAAVRSALEAHGLTVRLDPTPRWQRQFADAAERERFLQRYADAGVRTAGTLLDQGVCVAALRASRMRPRAGAQ